MKTIKENLSIGTLLVCNVEHEVSKTTGTMEWTGGRIAPTVWYQILNFLKWVYDRDKSEAQVRLFYNTKTKQWMAWAFPQEANTGMSAREIAGPEHNKQRAAFPHADDWDLAGTVHSHCSMSAFQSGTDKDNEEGQDGLHVTIGYLDKPVFDIDIRFYRAKNKFTPDIADFWAIPPQVLVERNKFNELFGVQVDLSRYVKTQMTKPKPEVGFPEEWKANVIVVKPTPTTYGGGGVDWRTEWMNDGGYGGYGDGGGHGWPDGQQSANGSASAAKPDIAKLARSSRAEKALEHIFKVGQFLRVTDVEMDDVLGNFESDDVFKAFANACRDYDVNPEDIMNEYIWMQHNYPGPKEYDEDKEVDDEAKAGKLTVSKTGKDTKTEKPKVVVNGSNK